MKAGPRPARGRSGASCRDIGAGRSGGGYGAMRAV